MIAPRLLPWYLRSCLGFVLLPAALVAQPLRFDFGSGPAAPGWRGVALSTAYTAERGYGFEVGSTGSFFSVAVPAEGNYRVTVTLGHPTRDTTTTIKAELRRLMVEQALVAAGAVVTRSFIVNTRTPCIAAANGVVAGEVKLKAPRETTQEAWAWDWLITLEFNGALPAVCAVEITPVGLPTIFLLGDSTVCDQSREPFTSWGQMLPRFFGEGVGIANHAESGETYRDSLARRRIDKIVSVLRPGDWVLMQFGHNDQKQLAAGTGAPFTTYQAEIKRHIAMVQGAGGVPVIISPMERRGFDEHGRVIPSLADYAEASRQVAHEAGVAFIDLNTMSKPFYEALGPVKSAAAFAAPGGKVDNTHHNSYGAYELAKCVAAAARAQHLGFAKYLATDFTGFDPAHPDAVETVNIPTSPLVTTVRPLGD